MHTSWEWLAFLNVDWAASHDYRAVFVDGFLRSAWDGSMGGLFQAPPKGQQQPQLGKLRVLWVATHQEGQENAILIIMIFI